MAWEHPVWKPPVPEGRAPAPDATVAEAPRRALPREEAFAWIAGEDPRPLLVLRECRSCAGTEKALLSTSENNEKTLLLSKWFHCVRLPVHVTEPDHPFAKLWEEKLPGGGIPHLFLATPDGRVVIPLRGDQSQSELHGAMEKMLAIHYRRDPARNAREIGKLLARLDHIDSMEATLKERFDHEIEKNGPDSPKLRRIRQDLDDLKQERKEVLMRYEKLLEVPLRTRKGDTSG